ncbi:WD40 repeat domain-containing protein, partial [Nostoc sp. UIC 10607]|uniref:WD40 repeat domain-containing protein n=1 Tax=Nostoc sp. UIC 10607 TaxID=3045935 RepID=UPI0039A2DFF8
MSEQTDINQIIKGTEYAATSATGDSNITIINYYYREDVKAAPVESTNASLNKDIPCPYRGLFHFSPDDAEFFFGRELFVEELVEAAKTRHFIPVFGASGSGKSSVVLAGLVPKLQKEGHWKFTHFRPGSDPFHALALALVPLYTLNLDATDRMAQARKLAGYFRDATLPLSDVFAQIKQNHPNDRVLLIADQFEELYTLCNDEAIRRSFLDKLLTNFQSPTNNSSFATVLVATMRADFLGNALSYRPFADVLQNADIKLGAMNREELSQVIEKPTQTLNVTFETRLVGRILDDVEDEPGNLPLLEFALTELWKRRIGKRLTHAAYEAIGQVKGALASYADEKYGKLSTTEQKQVRRIFIQLVRPGEGTEDTRRLATKAELGEASWSLVKQLADGRLVVTSRNAAEQETVEIVHEAMIRHWGELRQWMVVDRDFRAWQERLRATMHQWEKAARDEEVLLRGVPLGEAEGWLKKRLEELSKEERNFIQMSLVLRGREKEERERRRQLTIIGLTSGLVGALSLAGFSGWQWWQAELQRKQVEMVQLSQGEALSYYSQELFRQGKELDALIVSLRAIIPLQRRKASIPMQLVGVLRQVIYGGREYNHLSGHSDAVMGVAWSSDGQILASASIDKTVKLWRPDGSLITTLSGHDDAVLKVAWSPDSQTLASASSDARVKLWRRDGSLITTLSGHTGAVIGLAWSPDGQTLASASQDAKVKLWRRDGSLITTLSGHNNRVYGVAWSPDGQTLASASYDKTIKLWRRDGSLITTLSGHSDAVLGVAWSPDGQTLASASQDTTVKLWRRNGSLITTFSGNSNAVIYELAWSPDSQTLASASSDATVKLWRRDGFLITTLSGHDDAVLGVAWSLDGQTLASASADKTVKLWRRDASLITTLSGHSDVVRRMAWSPDGQTLASASDDKTIKLWRRDASLITTLSGYSDAAYGMAWSPDGQTLAFASADKTIKLWRRDGSLITTLSGHSDVVYGMAWSPDGQTLASASYDKTIKLWR